MKFFDIAFVGTSLTAGTGTGWASVAVNGGSWMPNLERVLQVGKTSRVRAHNFGYPGKNSTFGLSQTSEYVPLRANVYVFEFCMNDCPAAQNVSLAKSVQNVEAMANAVLSINPDASICLMTMNPVVGSGSAAAARSNLQAYYQNYRDAAASKGWLLVDNATSWAGASTTQIPDGIHPLLAEVENRLIPDILPVIGPLIP